MILSYLVMTHATRTVLLSTSHVLSEQDVVAAFERGSTTTMFIIGDSTLRYPFLKLCVFMGHKHVATRPGHVAVCEGRIGERPFKVAFAGQHEYGWYRPDALDVLKRETHMTPDVIVFNGGLHLLHLIPTREWSHYDAWRDAEHLLETFMDACAATTSHVLFVTSHAICETKFNGKYATAVQQFKHNPGDFAKACVKTVVNKHHESVVVARAQCLNATFTTDGVAKMNQRILHAYHAYLTRHSNLTGDVVDAFQMTMDACTYTEPGDGRHYHPLEYNELVAVFDLLYTTASS